MSRAQFRHNDSAITGPDNVLDTDFRKPQNAAQENLPCCMHAPALLVASLTIRTSGLPGTYAIQEFSSARALSLFGQGAGHLHPSPPTPPPISPDTVGCLACRL